jgi:hypothetical protein
MSEQRYGPNTESVIGFFEDVASLSDADVGALTKIGWAASSGAAGRRSQEAWAAVRIAAEATGATDAWTAALDAAERSAEAWTLGQPSGFFYLVRDTAMAIAMRGIADPADLDVLASGWDGFDPDFGESDDD